MHVVHLFIYRPSQEERINCQQQKLRKPGISQMSAYMHVERVSGCVRQHFTKLNATGVLPKEYYQQKQDDVVLLDAIVKVCCALNNMCEGVVPFE